MHPLDPETVDGSADELPAHAGATVVVVSGKNAGETRRVGDNFIVGRANDADLQVPSAEVSRHHARITKASSGQYFVEDLGSKNGIQVNGTKVGKIQLHFGDRISIGDRAVLLFSSGERSQSPLLHTAKMASLGRLAGGIAHDFNHMLGVMKLSLSHLREMPADTPIGNDDAQGSLSDAEEVVNQAIALTNQLLHVARGGKSRDAPVALSTVVADALHMVTVSGKDLLTINADIQEGVVVGGDDTQLHQVVQNLCSNARDAMPHGGTLTVRLHRLASDREGHRPQIMLEVQDSGYGMTEEVMKQVFEPFFSTKPRAEGTGLGLSTVYGIVTAHDGHISVQSEVGVGTTFRVTLPESTTRSGDITTGPFG